MGIQLDTCVFWPTTLKLPKTLMMMMFRGTSLDSLTSITQNKIQSILDMKRMSKWVLDSTPAYSGQPPQNYDDEVLRVRPQLHRTKYRAFWTCRECDNGYWTRHPRIPVKYPKTTMMRSREKSLDSQTPTTQNKINFKHFLQD